MTDTDELEAAWDAVHDALPAGWHVGRRGIHLALIAFLLAGCLPSTGQITPSFESYVTASGYEFAVAAPPTGAIPATEILARLRGERAEPPFFPGMRLGEPVYGILSCVDAQACGEAGVAVPGSPVAVWFVPLVTSEATGGDGWAVMDATTGVLIWPDG